MIAGHLGIALGVKSLRPSVPLGWLLVATVAPDMLDVSYAFANICSSYGAYSHSLPAIVVIATLMMAGAFAGTRSGAIAIVVGAVACSHVAMDWITGVKTLWPGGPVVGLYLYRWPAIDFLLELPLIVGGWWMLRRSRIAPRWAISGAALALMLSGQATIDAVIQFKWNFGTEPKSVCTLAGQPSYPH